MRADCLDVAAGLSSALNTRSCALPTRTVTALVFLGFLYLEQLLFPFVLLFIFLTLLLLH